MNYVQRYLSDCLDNLGLAHGGLYYRVNGEGFQDYKGNQILTDSELRNAELAKERINAAKCCIIDALQLLDSVDLKFK